MREIDRIIQPFQIEKFETTVSQSILRFSGLCFWTDVSKLLEDAYPNRIVEN